MAGEITGRENVGGNCLPQILAVENFLLVQRFLSKNDKIGAETHNFWGI